MSTKPPIAYIDIRVFAHATEDPEKFKQPYAISCQLNSQKPLVFEKQSCTGHHGNPIILFTSKLTEKKLLLKALEKIGKELSALDKEDLNRDIKLHLEKGNMYLRFDKQSAFLGSLKLTQNDPIHLKIHFKNKTAQEIMEISKQTGLLP